MYVVYWLCVCLFRLFGVVYCFIVLVIVLLYCLMWCNVVVFAIVLVRYCFGVLCASVILPVCCIDLCD